MKPQFSATQADKNKGLFKPRFNNFTKKLEYPSNSKHPSKWDDYRQQKDHQQDGFQNKNKNYHYDKRYRPRCFECGSYEYLKPQCPRIRTNEKRNCVSANDDLLESYTIKGKVNAVFIRSQTKKTTEDQSPKEKAEQPEEILDSEIAEEILPLADEDLSIKELIKVNSKEFIEAQHQSRELSPLLSESRNENSNKSNDFKIKDNGLLVKRKFDKIGNERELIVVPEKFREPIK
ncbi:retrovirus-related Pol polyprotein from transposon 412 [Nephila pilipes]|uniref:Retrovirus-related Pol polyprotein from transposon 412 n=1 Tax=Nephila pilipes TaxID=299642 RepID=A0A8X6TUI2_NEPPI|nr:retrovirus-related Pol polyprotein from transposon 412 [Nephila pilipes]